jgi:isopentenyl diphosphate isomerase/L-lactate dehydrogenase-like FMN-dependent dehydrogenase
MAGIAMQQRLSIEDYRRAAERRLPRLVFDYMEGGAETESTVRANRGAYEAVSFRPRGAMDPAGVDIGVSVLGAELQMPILLAPCGMARVVHPRGDLAGARAASRAGTVFVQSTMSGHTVEEVVAEAAGAPVWYQLYRVGPVSRVEQAIDRARDAGVAALVVTIDTAGGSLRERDRRSGGLALLGASRLRAAPHFFPLTRSPRWLAERLADGIRPQLPNIIGEDGKPQILGQGVGPVGLTWADLSWVRRRWSGPIVIKGLVTAEDALRSVEEGAAAVVVSNHGGRQLDGAEATLRALPEVVAAVGGTCEVLVDGGVRSGTDVLKAICLGARAVLVGRPWLYGLAASGDAGVEGALKVLADGVRRNLVLLGAPTLAELDRSYVRAPSEWNEAKFSEFSLSEEGLGKGWH